MSLNRDWNYSNLIFDVKKFQSLAHNCAERVDVEWISGSADVSFYCLRLSDTSALRHNNTYED